MNGKKREILFTFLAIIAALALIAGALLALFAARENGRQAQLGRVTVEPIPSERLPVPERTEDWLAGDWAGIVSGQGEADPNWTDFGTATLEGYYPERCTLLRVYPVEEGFEAAFGSALWRVTEHGMDGFSMVCTRASTSFDFHPDSIYFERFDFEVGQTADFTYSEQVKSSVPGAQVPERHILRGEVSPKQDYQWNWHLLLALLPPGDQRGEDAGVYPCWYGGYENMDGDFRGMFALGVNGRGRRMLGMVLDRGDGIEIVSGVFDGRDYERTHFYAPRDMRGQDLTQLYAMDDAPGVFFPHFSRYKADGLPDRWTDTSLEHKLYYETEFVQTLKKEIEEMRKLPQDIWTERQILARRGFIEYAQQLVWGAYDDRPGMLKPYIIPSMVQLDPKYRGEVSLAGLSPGDTIEDAKKLYDLRELRADEEERFGLHGLFRGKTKFYTDGKGLLLTVSPGSDGRIGQIEVHRPGYETPDGRQVGDPFERDRSILYGKDARLTYGDGYLQEGIDAIDVIRLSIVLDRAFAETQLDIDGDGAPERLTLSGRSTGSYLEQAPMFFDEKSKIVESYDIGTKTTLRVYKEGDLLYEYILPFATGYLHPSFCGKLQKNEPGKVWIVSETGGTGLEEPIYLVALKDGNFSAEYLGMIDIYS